MQWDTETYKYYAKYVQSDRKMGTSISQQPYLHTVMQHRKGFGYSPFEFVYSHAVMGSMRIFPELWTKGVNYPDKKTTYQYDVDLNERLESTCQIE